MTKKKNVPVCDEPIQTTNAEPPFYDWLKSTTTHHTKQLRKLAIDKKICSEKQLCLMTDDEVEKFVNKSYCCLYVRPYHNDNCDMGMMILIPRLILSNHAIIIER
jgi:hypothetical protein